MIFAKQFDQITKADVEQLVSGQVPEGRELDYKQQLPGNTQDDKREYLYDLTSFANTSGGVIIFGIQEQRDPNNAPTGLPADAVGLGRINPDKEIQRLESLQLTGVERRVPGVQFKAIDGLANGPVLLVSVPKSWASPHIVTLGGIHRFYARGERGKYLMDWHQIRSSFALSESLAEKVRGFRYERLARIAATDSLPTQMAGAARAVLHVFPISAVDPATSIDILRIRAQPGSLPPPGWKSSSGYNGSPNLDGYAQMIDGVSYVQLFRSGAIEAVDSYLLNWQNKRMIPFPTLEQEIAEEASAYVNLLASLNVQQPFFLMASLLGINGHQIAADGIQMIPTRAFDRDDLILPEVMLETLGADVPLLLKPAFDTMWQAVGRDGSPSYDGNGKWRWTTRR
jgi:hypothetical protein